MNTVESEEVFVKEQIYLKELDAEIDILQKNLRVAVQISGNTRRTDMASIELSSLLHPCNATGVVDRLLEETHSYYHETRIIITLYNRPVRLLTFKQHLMMPQVKRMEPQIYHGNDPDGRIERQAKYTYACIPESFKTQNHIRDIFPEPIRVWKLREWIGNLGGEV